MLISFCIFSTNIGLSPLKQRRQKLRAFNDDVTGVNCTVCTKLHQTNLLVCGTRCFRREYDDKEIKKIAKEEEKITGS